MRRQDFFVLCCVLVACIHDVTNKEDALDETTIYRFDDTFDEVEDYQPDRHPFLVQGKSSGWIDTSNVMMNLHFPWEEKRVWNTEKHHITDVFSIDMNIPFAISTNVTSFDIIFMSSKFPEPNRLIILRMMNSTTEMLSCNFVEQEITYTFLGIGPRKCRKYMHSDDWGDENPSTYFFHTSSSGGVYTLSMKRTISGYFKEVLIDNDLSEMKSLCIRTDYNHARFELWKPEPVLALAERTAHFYIEYEYERARGFRFDQKLPGLVCFGLYYYIDPESGGEISFHITKEDKNITIGNVSSNGKQGSWKYHRALAMADSGTIYIVAKKKTNGRVLISNPRKCNENDSWDSTTFAKAGSVSIHARTNALGRPFILYNGSIVEPNVGIDIQGCPDYNLNCGWMLNGWSRQEKKVTYHSSAPLPLWREVSFHETVLPNTMSQVNQFSEGFNFTVTTQTRYNNGLFLYIHDQQRPNDGSFYAIYKSENTLEVYESLYQKRLRYVYGSNCWFPGENNRRCSHICSASSHNFYWNYYGASNFSVISTKTRKQVIIRWQLGELICNVDSTFLSMPYISFASRSITFDVTGTDTVNYMLNLDELEGQMTSPLLPPPTSQLCFSVLYHMFDGKLKLTAELVNGTTIHLEEFNSTHGWEYRRVVKDVGRLAMKLVLHGSKEDTGHIAVQRIAGCHPEEDIVQLGRESVLHINQPPLLKNKKEVNSSYPCINGGVPNEQGYCSCPPGFAGDTCEEGCGEDRFGNDCNGRCSLSSRGCRGMFLCKSFWGCNCAAGYTGSFCLKDCNKGKYGADCQQTCGYCQEGSCDRFTGRCPNTCQEGYYPPMCKEETSYFVAAPEVSRADGKIFITLDVSEENIRGKGSPLYFQIQYKEFEYSPWENIYSDKLTHGITAVTVNMSEPSSKENFSVRAIIINNDGDSYQGLSVPVAVVRTNCKVPDSAKYLLNATDIKEHSFIISWQALASDTDMCEVLYYEVYLNERFAWLLHAETKSTYLNITQRSPGEHYKVKLRAVTTLGHPTAFSETVEVATNALSITEIQNLVVTASDSTQLKLSWDYPHPVKNFSVAYQCIKLLACQNDSCSFSNGNYRTYDTTAILRDLLPHAQYNISVIDFSDVSNRYSVIKALTAPAGSQATAAVTEESISELTNTSFIVRWDPPSDCSKLNGFPQGYRYRLRLSGQNTSLMDSNTLKTSAKFEQLIPHTSYEVDIFINTNGGWDEKHPLTILVTTRATTPEKVIGLTVYKKSRREIGLRWSAPLQTYGKLASFTITHVETSIPRKPFQEVISPKLCSAWPDLYCFTVGKLHRDLEYSLTVQARNVEIPEDGEPSTVFARTKEGAPTPPSYIQLLSQDVTSLTVQWGIPLLLNGVLRSFIVSVEEVDSFNATDCCQNFPLQEVTVQNEDSSYLLEVGGLRPASTYTISISGKTVSLGPPINMTVHTKPPLPVIPSVPLVKIDDSSEQIKIHLKPITEFQELLRGYLLLLVPEDQDQAIPEARILDDELAEEISKAVNSSFYIVGEYSQEHLMQDEIFYLQEDENYSSGSVLCELSPLPQFKEGTYHFVQVAILKYKTTYNFSFKKSEAFSFS